MLRVILLAVVVLSLLASSSYADKALVRVYFDNPEHLKTVVGEFDDVAGWGGNRYADIVVRSERVSELKALAPNHEILIPDVDAYIRSAGVLGVGSAYHTYEEMFAEMDSVTTANPAICRLDSIGHTYEDRAIWAMKISDNVGTTEDEPRVLYLGNHHAREIISVEIPLYIMYWFTDNYGTDSLATFLVDNREIWIIPMMNPDGREYVENVGDWRKNRDPNGDGSIGVDLNRNWGYAWGYDDIGSDPNPSGETYRGDAPFSELETQTIRDFMETYQFSTCLSYHSHGRLFLYPWGFVHDPCPDYAIFAALGDSLASFNGYTNQQGAQLYPTNGDSDDWMYGEQTTKEKVFSFTPEVGTQFYPPASEILTLCEENLGPAIVMAEYAGSVERILPPGTPVINALAEDEDGDYDVSWTPDYADTINPAVRYALMERIGPGRTTDDAEVDGLHFIRDKFRWRTTRYHSGSYSFYGGTSDDRNSKLTANVPMDVAADDTLTFWTWYEIETDWDYAYVEVSTDGGAYFQNIPGDITTTSNPNGNNAGHGITGNSGGWIEAHFPLGAFADSTVIIRFRYKTDAAVLEEGIYVDDIYPVQTFDSTAVLSDAIVDTAYSVSNLAGTYYYEVRAMDTDGQWGYWSQRESTTVTVAGIGDTGETGPVVGFRNPVYLSSGARLAITAPGKQVAVFDVQGRLLTTLKVSPQGEASWDLKDRSGNLVSPGIYFMSFDPAREVATRKVVILK
jgi:hypothetical protein